MNSSHELTASSNLFNNITLYKPWTTYVYLSAYVINFILGLPINSYVLWLISVGKGSGIVPEFFSLNLAVCETIFCLSSLYLIIIYKIRDFSSSAFFIVALPSAGRPLINCVICIEHYLAVLHPVSFLKYKPLRYRLVCSAVIWVTILVFGVFCMFALPNNMNMFVCAYMSLYSLLLSIKLFCFLAIFKALKNPRPGEKRKEREKANLRKRKAITVILFITASMFFQYTPLFLVGTFYRILSVADFDLFWCVALVISFLLPYVSPVLYIIYIRLGIFDWFSEILKFWQPYLYVRIIK